MKQGSVRIIAGEWRGRRLQVPEVKDLRPTPDRVRETLFNWLAPTIQGARCLDLFAGSGVLGFEALSRGASEVVWVDADRKVVLLIHQQLAIFKTDKGVVYCASIPAELKPAAHPFDIIFLDPPYQSGLLLPTCFHLEANGFLAEEALIYLEASSAINEKELPANWHIIKTKQAGQVAYHLVKRESKA